MAAQLIVQCFDIKFENVTTLLPNLSQQLVTHIQISPVQKHCKHLPNSKWYRLYQPVGTEIGNSLGSQNDLQLLINKANEYNIGIIADIVLHHRCWCPLCNPWHVVTYPYHWWWKTDKKKDDSQVTFESPSSPNQEKFTFHYNPSDPRYNFHNWGPKEDVESKKTFMSHVQLFKNLISMGFVGFRLDAVKHIPPDYVKSVLSESGVLNNNHLLCYGEVLDGNLDICHEYISRGIRLFDFPQTFSLIHELGYGGDIRKCLKEFLPYDKSICLADCHDSILGDSYKFGDKTDSILAACILLAKGRGIPLIYHSLLNESSIISAIQFYHFTHGSSFCCDDTNSNDQLLFLRRGNNAFAIFNKSGEWQRRENVHLSGLQNGKYKELTYGFEVKIYNGDIVEWGHQNRNVSIGPRSCLFCVWQQHG